MKLVGLGLILSSRDGLTTNGTEVPKELTDADGGTRRASASAPPRVPARKSLPLPPIGTPSGARLWPLPGQPFLRSLFSGSLLEVVEWRSEPLCPSISISRTHQSFKTLRSMSVETGEGLRCSKEGSAFSPSIPRHLDKLPPRYFFCPPPFLLPLTHTLYLCCVRSTNKVPIGNPGKAVKSTEKRESSNGENKSSNPETKMVHEMISHMD